eukprot:3016631-Rhodomonas_salina.1
MITQTIVPGEQPTCIVLALLIPSTHSGNVASPSSSSTRAISFGWNVLEYPPAGTTTTSTITSTTGGCLPKYACTGCTGDRVQCTGGRARISEPGTKPAGFEYGYTRCRYTGTRPRVAYPLALARPGGWIQEFKNGWNSEFLAPSRA